MLIEQIHNKISQFNGFDSGTQYKIGNICGLDRRNLPYPGILDLFSEPKISWFNFLVDLKEKSTHCEKNRLVLDL